MGRHHGNAFRGGRIALRRSSFTRGGTPSPERMARITDNGKGGLGLVLLLMAAVSLIQLLLVIWPVTLVGGVIWSVVTVARRPLSPPPPGWTPAPHRSRGRRVLLIVVVVLATPVVVAALVVLLLAFSLFVGLLFA